MSNVAKSSVWLARRAAESRSCCGATIIGLIPKREGRIEIMGMELDKAGLAEIQSIGRRWGILFQQGALFSSLTVRQNVQFPLRENLEISEPLLDELAVAKLEMVGLTPTTATSFLPNCPEV